MIAAVDVCYSETGATAGGVLFAHWASERPARELREFIELFEPYEPGSFYKRELPCLLELLGSVKDRVETVIVDGYVWLGPETRRGLGAHLYRALDEKVPVIGVAKSMFRGATNAQAVLRGRSKRPLYVTAAGMDPVVAAKLVKGMHGPHRIPTLLKRADELCRSGEKHASS
ncbi:MAG: endonuclease V [Desulfomonilaceae bacterium]